jgi:hypothetical protein
VALISMSPHPLDVYKSRLQEIPELVHVTVEISTFTD